MANESDFNILSHTLVPKHRVLSEAEVKDLLDSYNISKLQLPEIGLSDPAMIAIGATEGAVVEIKRKGYLIKEEIYFRRVVK